MFAELVLTFALTTAVPAVPVDAPCLVIFHGSTVRVSCPTLRTESFARTFAKSAAIGAIDLVSTEYALAGRGREFNGLVQNRSVRIGFTLARAGIVAGFEHHYLKAGRPKAARNVRRAWQALNILLGAWNVSQH